MGTRRKGRVVSLSGDPVKHYGEAPRSFALRERLRKAGITDVIEPARRSVGR